MFVSSFYIARITQNTVFRDKDYKTEEGGVGQKRF